MGGCGSKRGKVYASTEDPLLVEVRAKIAARDDCGKGMPVGKLNELLVDIGAEALDAAALDAAVKRLDAGGTGHVSADAFLNWFAASPDGGAGPEPEPEVHPNVTAGLKDEGEASGTGGYDDDLLDPAGRAAKEAELDRMLEDQLRRENAER